MGKVKTLDEALAAAEEARKEDYLSRYPSACVVLAEALAAAQAELAVLKARSETVAHSLSEPS